MYKFLILCLSVTLLTACYKPPKTEDEQQQNPKVTAADLQHQKQLKLLKEMSGVWVESNTLITIQLDPSNVHFIIDERPIHAKLGDIDIENETVNIIVTKLADYTDEIITLRRHWNANRTQFTLYFTHFDGSRAELGFIRQIGQDDKLRIERIYAQEMQNQYEMDTPTRNSIPQVDTYYDANDTQPDYQDEGSEEPYYEDPSTPAHTVDDTTQAVEDAVRAAEEAAQPALQPTQPQNTY